MSLRAGGARRASEQARPEEPVLQPPFGRAFSPRPEEGPAASELRQRFPSRDVPLRVRRTAPTRPLLAGAPSSPCETLPADRRARARRAAGDARSGGRSALRATDRDCSRVLRRETVPVATQPAGLCSVASPTVLSDTPGRSIGRDSFVIDTTYDQDVSRPGRRPRWPRRRGDDRASPAPAAARWFCAFVRALQRAAPSSPLSVLCRRAAL